MSIPPGPPPSLNIRGAVDLSALKRPAAGPPGSAGTGPAGSGGAPGGASAVVVDVTEQTFGEIVQQSTTVPVVLDLWASWCEPCKQLTPVLEALAVEYAGRFLLAKVDVDAEQQIAAALQVQSLPTVMAVVAGRPLMLFQGAYPEAQVRQVLDELLNVAAQQGVTGRIEVVDAADDADTDTTEPAEPVEEPLPPLHAEAFDAIDRGDMDAAADAYRRALAENPADAMATAGLAQVGLYRRTEGADPEAARQTAAADPSDVDAALLVADLDLLGGHVEDAFGRLVDTVRLTAGAERETVRVRLVELFDVVGGDDARVAAARRALASALF